MIIIADLASFYELPPEEAPLAEAYGTVAIMLSMTFFGCISLIDLASLLLKSASADYREFCAKSKQKQAPLSSHKHATHKSKSSEPVDAHSEEPFCDISEESFEVYWCQ